MLYNQPTSELPLRISFFFCKINKSLYPCRICPRLCSGYVTRLEGVPCKQSGSDARTRTRRPTGGAYGAGDGDGGFADVVERHLYWPLNMWLPGKEEKRIARGRNRTC